MKIKTRVAWKNWGLVVLAACALASSPGRASHCAPENLGEEKRVALTQVALTPRAEVSRAQSATEPARCDHCPAPAKPTDSQSIAQKAPMCAGCSASGACCCAPVSPNKSQSVSRVAPEMPLALATKRGTQAHFVLSFTLKSRVVLEVPRSRGAPSPFAPRGPPVVA